MDSLTRSDRLATAAQAAALRAEDIKARGLCAAAQRAEGGRLNWTRLLHRARRLEGPPHGGGGPSFSAALTRRRLVGAEIGSAQSRLMRCGAASALWRAVWRHGLDWGRCLAREQLLALRAMRRAQLMRAPHGLWVRCGALTGREGHRSGQPVK